MKKRILTLVLVLALLFSFACTNTTPAATEEDTAAAVEATEAPAEEATEAPAEEAPAEEPFKVALLLPGLVSDAGWNASGYYGSIYLNENVENCQADYIESVNPTNCEATIRDYCERGYNMIVGLSFDQGDYLMKVAPEYPEIAFVWSSGYKTMDNLCTLNPPYQESAYLCGMIAAKMTKTGTIGFISAQDNTSMITALEGYKEGARSVNPEINVIYGWTGSWSDVELGMQTAIAQFEQGVDVLMGRGDGLALGCFQACIEKGVYCFGDVSDQNSIAPELILTSTIINIGVYLENIINDVQAGQFVGKAYSLGMPAGVCDIADFHGLVSDEIAAEVMAAREQIISGQLVIEPKTEISE